MKTNIIMTALVVLAILLNGCSQSSPGTTMPASVTNESAVISAAPNATVSSSASTVPMATKTAKSSPAAKPTSTNGTILAPAPSGGLSANQTVGLVYQTTRASSGYTLFAPNRSTTTYLIDMDGKLVHTWESKYTPGQSVYLLDNGTLLRSIHISNVQGPAGGGVQKIAWEGTLLWDFRYLADICIPHHDIRPLPNGNILLICWDIKTKEEAIAAGRKPALLSQGSLWSEKIVEIKPEGINGGSVVWEWDLWDHLVQDYDSSKANYGVVADHPELVDINYGGAGNDWIHANAVDYSPILDQIMISAHNMGEIWIIDHSTTAKEAAGSSGGRSDLGGGLLYRWGNPQAYCAGTAKDQKLFAQHNANWIAGGLAGEGDILIFNNGDNRQDGDYSSVDEITPPVDAWGHYTLESGSAYGPNSLTWAYKAKNPTDFYADKISGAQRLPNGDTLICHGPLGTFFEVTSQGEIVWEYINPVVGNTSVARGAVVPSDPGGGTQNACFRATRFVATDTALLGKILISGSVIEK
jgi:hypothetical protein